MIYQHWVPKHPHVFQCQTIELNKNYRHESRERLLKAIAMRLNLLGGDPESAHMHRTGERHMTRGHDDLS